MVNAHFLKGNEALEKKKFLLLQRKGIWRGNQNLKKENSIISGLTNDFLEVQKVSSMVENGELKETPNLVASV